MSNLWSDFRYALRMMGKSRAFTIVAVLTLAIGIGANTAIFSVVYGVLLRPLPFEEPARLVYVWHTPPQTSFPGVEIFSASPANYFDWKAQATAFEVMSIQAFTSGNFVEAGEPQTLRGQQVSPEFFTLLGVRPRIGRTFAPGEDQPGHDNVLVISNNLWKTRFGSDPGIIGRSVNLDDVPHTIIGVMGPEYHYPRYAQYWQPLSWTTATRNVRGEHHYTVLARLKPGVDIRAAQAEMDTISRRLAEAYPVDNKGWGARVISMHEQIVGDVRPALLVLLGAVAFVLLIACANVANLMLAKVLDRRIEIAIRSALGASRRRILQQMLAEAVLLALLGGVLGVILAQVGVSAIVRYLSDQLPRAYDIAVDRWVLVFTIFISVIAGVMTGFTPAWRLSNTNVNDALKHGGRGIETGGKRTRTALVVTEVALALVLLAGAGLLMRTLWALQSVNPGFDPEGLLTASLSVSKKKLTSPAQVATYYQQVQEQLRHVPGMDSAALIDDLPMAGGSMQPVALEGYPAAAMADQPEVAVRLVSPDYFKTMRIRVLQGREFNPSDTADRPHVAIISQAMAKKFWPNEDALGKHIGLSFFQGPPRQVIGIVDDVKINGLDAEADAPTFYHPVSQLDVPQPQFGDFRAPSLTLVMRTSLKPKSLAGSAVNAVHQVDASTPVNDVLTMEEFMGDTLEPQRFNMLLLGTFAVIALLLAALGTYSLLAYSVRRRTGEIGIRVAVGAARSDILRLILWDGMKLIAIGVLVGLFGALTLSRFLRSMVFGVRPTDPLTFVAVAVLLALVALLACYLPARRALRIDPMIALREE